MGLTSCVEFAGALGREETLALLHGCRALVEPSLYETVGESVIHAMQLGRPVLRSQVPGLAAVAGSAALSFDPHRPADLACALERAEREPAALDWVAALGREHVATLNDAHQVAEAYVGVLHEAMTPCRPSR